MIKEYKSDSQQGPLLQLSLFKTNCLKYKTKNGLETVKAVLTFSNFTKNVYELHQLALIHQPRFRWLNCSKHYTGCALLYPEVIRSRYVHIAFFCVFTAKKQKLDQSRICIQPINNQSESYQKTLR